LRRLSDVSFAFGVLLAVILTVLNWSLVSLTPTAAAQQAPKIVRSNAPATTPMAKPADLHPVFAPPGTELYEAKRGDSVVSLARQYVKRTSYLTSGELAEAIRKANGDRTSNNLKAGEQVIVPGILAAPIVEKTVSVPKDFEVRAIYLTGVMAGSDHGIRIVKHWREVGGNAVVFDIKDSDGSVNIPFEHPLAGRQHVYIRDVPKFARFLHSQGMHAIARIAIFRDQRLVETHPELAVKSARSGNAWRENGKLVWTDTSNPKVQEYNIALAKYVADLGVDEIQFDYVRFPAEGDQKDATFYFQKEHPTWHRSDVITDFLKHAYAELHPKGVLLSLDVFGVMAWQRPVDLSHTGQDIVGMAKYCDVLSPMIYPSHFFGMDGYAHPGDAPEHFIGVSMERFKLITRDSTATIRPWLQAFRWRTKTYSPEYIETQVRVSKEKGGVGFLFWNAGNDYSKPYAAMPVMKASREKKYFRGDEMPGVAAVPATAASTTGGQ
jgi:hypothetical protein